MHSLTIVRSQKNNVFAFLSNTELMFCHALEPTKQKNFEQLLNKFTAFELNNFKKNHSFFMHVLSDSH